MIKDRKKWHQLTSKQKRKRYKIGVCAFLIFFSISFIQTPSPKFEDLQYKAIVLTGAPQFKITRGRSKSYWLKLYVNATVYEVSGIDYKYLKHRSFKKFVKKGDTLEVLVKDKKIYTMKFNNTQLMRYAEAQLHKSKNKVFSRILFGTGLFVCFIPLFIKEDVISKIGVDSKFHFVHILIMSLVMAFIVGIIVIGGFEYISGKEFMYS